MKIDANFEVVRVGRQADVKQVVSNDELPLTHPIFSWLELFDMTVIRPLSGDVGKGFTPASCIALDVLGALETNPWPSQTEFDNRASSRLVPIGHGPQGQTLHLGTGGLFYGSMDDFLWHAGDSLLELAQVSFKLVPYGKSL